MWDERSAARSRLLGVTDLDDMSLREASFAWLRSRMLVQPVFTRDELGQAQILGQPMRLVGTQTGIWKPRQMGAALSILTGYYADSERRPYADEFGADEMLRYKWRGTDRDHADNRALRRAMETVAPLIWFVGVGTVPGSKAQLFQPVMPVWLVAEESEQHQFVVALEESQRSLVDRGHVHTSEVERRYNLTTARRRLHQPVFRSMVLLAYQQRCAICRLPFSELLDAAHIKADTDGGSASVSNGLALCKIHHGAFDADILGISPDYKVAIKESVLETFDGPTLQHALKEMHGKGLAQLPSRKIERPQRELLDERYQRFLRAS